MSAKHLLFESEAREKLLAGATALADAVRVTLGPKSKCGSYRQKVGPTTRLQ
jgi:chaperonin GroEL